MTQEQIQEIRYLVGEAWKGAYNPTTVYGNANVVQDTEGLSVYRSLKPGNSGHPLTDQQWWFEIIDMSSIKALYDQMVEGNNTMAENELERVAAEQSRVSAEQSRVNAENTRIYNENQRINDETTRVRAEQDRITQENQRISQEQGRVGAEQQRVAKEQQRVSQESSRVAAETQRQLNENDRQAVFANDHAVAVDDHEQAEQDHTRAESDHETAVSDHGQMTDLVERADADHEQAASDHTRAESDHTTAASDHTQAGSDHTRAGQDHTRAESDHAAVEVYVDSLGAFDISSYHATGDVLAKYADLTAALGTNGANIPDALRKGGMSVKFVQSSDNKYVQFRLMSDLFNTTVANWQGIDDEPTAGSDNLVKSGGVANILGTPFDIESESPVTAAYNIVAGEKYCIKNLLSTPVTISHRDTPSGTNSDIINIAGNSEEIYEPTSNGVYIRCGSACHITIEPTKGVNYKLNKVIDNSDNNSKAIIKNREDEDNFIIRNFVADGVSKFSYNFIEGKEYYLQSNCNNPVTISYIKADGTTSVLDNLYPRFVIKFIAIAEAVGIQVGDACDINIIPNIVSNEESKGIEFYDGTIATNLEIGQTIDIETLATENGHHAIIPVNKFDEVYVDVTSSGAPRVCCFTDKNYVKVSSYDRGTSLNGTLICPCDGYCIVNAFGSNYSAIKYFRKSLDLVCSSIYRQVFTSNAPAKFQYRFEKGKKYVITCLSTRPYTTFGIRVTQSGTLYNRVNIKGFGGKAIITAEIDALYLTAGDPTTCTVEEYDSYSKRVEDLENKIFNYGIDSPLVEFDFDSTFIDCTADLNGMDFSNSNIMEQIYAKFDALMSANPNYITKVDAASANEANLTYPTYANLGGSASGNYLATPTYRTYMYKLIDNSPIINALLPKKKLFIVGATHGNEIAAPFNLYLFAKQLCEGTISDYFKLRAAYDIYILPCLNGYGMYHNQRSNANNVNICRNFPTANWSESGDSTNPQDDYTGASAGSAFETQLVMKIVDKYNFDILIDHHNYAKLDWQFYCDMSYPRFLPLTYKCLVDCCCAFVKNLPYYFGSKYKLFFNVSNASAPNAFQSVMIGQMSRWGFERKMPFACTLEICSNINYINGEYSTDFNDLYGADTFAVGEFTLRNQLCRYGGLVLGNTY